MCTSTEDKTTLAQLTQCSDTTVSRIPNVPLTILNQAKDGQFLCACHRQWYQYKVNENGKEKTKRHKVVTNETIGFIEAKDGLGIVIFKEEFYQHHPELRNYIVKRVGPNLFEFTPIEPPKQTKFKFSRIVISDNLKEGVAFKRPLKADKLQPPRFFKGDLSVGAILPILNACASSGVRLALSSALQEVHNLSETRLQTALNHLVARIVYMTIHKRPNCEHIENFYKSHYFPNYESLDNYTLYIVTELLTPKFINSFQEAYIAYYIKRRNFNAEHKLAALNINSFSMAPLPRISFRLQKDLITYIQYQMKVIYDASLQGMPLFYKLYKRISPINEQINFVNEVNALKSRSMHIKEAHYLATTGTTMELRALLIKEPSCICKMPLEPNTSAALAIAAALENNIDLSCNWLDYEDGTSCYIYTQQEVYRHQLGNTQAINVNYHVYYNQMKHQETIAKTNERIQTLMEQATAGEEISEEDQKFLERISNFKAIYYEDCKPYKNLRCNKELVDKLLQYAGFTVLATSDLKLGSIEIKRHFERIQALENQMPGHKEIIEALSLREPTAERLLSYQFTLWLSTLVRIELLNQIQAIKEQSPKVYKKYQQSFDSLDLLITELSEISLDCMNSGVMLHPYTDKHKALMKALSIKLP